MIRAAVTVATAMTVAGCGLSTNANCAPLGSFEERMETARQSLDPRLSADDRYDASYQNARNCLVLKARSYRSASADVRQVAEAVVEDCSDAIIRHAIEQEKRAEAVGITRDIRDVRTGQPANYNTWAFAKFGRMAHLEAVIAKTYNCKAPA